MSKRFDNKRLIIVLAGLLAIFLLTVVVRIPRQKSTLKEKLVSFDTSRVESIIIIPKAATGKQFEFVKENRNWSVRQDQIISEPVRNAVVNIFSDILETKPQSLAAVDKSKWKEYELTDSLATRIKFLDKQGKTLADLMIGKFSYRQVNNPYSNGGNNVEGTSFVRLYGDKKIYAVEGFLSFSLSGRFNDWRDKSFLNCKKEDLTKITFTYPSDSSYVLSKSDSLWYVGSLPADSANTSNYFSSIGMVEGEEFMDDYKPVAPPVYQMNIEGNNLLNITVKCYQETGKDYYVFNSSLNPAIYFTGKKNGMFEKLFKPVKYFLHPGKQKR